MASTGLRAGSDRFLPPDPRVEEPHRLTPQLALRVGLLGALALFVFAVLFLRLWALQILSGNEYLRAAQTNQLRTVRIEAKRGPILDRKGRPLVTNAPSTAVLVWPADLPLERRYHELRRLAKVLDVPLAPIVADMKKRRGDPLTPVVVKTDVDKRHVYYLEEHGEDFPGVQVAYTYVRRYDQGMLAAHVVGHVGEISPEQLKKKRRQNYRAGDKIGQGGLEWAFDRYLRGRPGLAQLRVDSLGRPRSDLVPRQIPTDGNGIQLTLDIDVQRAAERALKTW
ncbi:MAG: hypothetical protein H0U03_05345, partial [Actinobacteria bacterium]|nr:hypothetical protein [Actinomycetota bacterium]